MKTIKFLFLFVAFIYSTNNFAQVGIGTDDPKGALDITSTTSGLLVPRMTSANRDAMPSPVANGMLIYNTTNNTFEVYKSLCSCWVTINDSGITPAQNLANTAPVVSTIDYNGKFIAGETVNVSYVYFDGQLDPEGLTTIKWQISPSTTSATDVQDIPGATGINYTISASAASNFIRAVIIPRASAGILNGTFTAGPWKLVEVAGNPTANNLVVAGTPAQGSPLSASYTFAGGNGTELLDATTGTQFLWETASNASGQGSSTASLYGAPRFTNTYIPQVDQLGRYIRVFVQAADTNGLTAQSFINSPWVGPITQATEAAPVATNVSYSPAPAVLLQLSGTYSYFDVNNDPEGVSTYQWFRADSASGLNQQAIAGATAATYTVQATDSNKHIGFAVTPIALSGTTTGTQSTVFYNANATLPVANFTFTGSAIRQNPVFFENRAMNSVNNIQVEINATTAGGIVFSSTSVNGYSFSANVTVAAGIQWVTLTATGTQTAYNAAGDTFTITGTGFTTETRSIVIDNTRLGGNFTSHFNGWVSGSNATQGATSYTVGETFNNNGNCAARPISTSVCSGSVTGASGTVYPVVSINGQCWMQTNLNEAPSNFAYSNSWANTLITDVGLWGYNNIAVPNGSAGWATTPQVTNAGLLYQWSAAMNGATHERAQGACPSGWHIPSDCEWMYLEHGLGMTITDQNSNNTGRTSANVSGKLRSTVSSGTNVSNFTLLLTGMRAHNNGAFNTNQGFYQSSNAGFVRQFAGGATSNLWRFTSWATSSATLVRCLKD